MIFITGADIRFREIVQEWENKISLFGYNYQIYDLGNLGIGKRGFEETDDNFRTTGYYNSIGGVWKSTGLWKPRVIADAIINTNEDIVYLDADAFLQKPFIINWDFDIGVVQRVENTDCNALKTFMRGKYNAGVIFFRNNDRVKDFIIKWNEEIKIVDNDQAALNKLLDKSNLDIRVFPMEYNTNVLTGRTIIFHETGNKKRGKSFRQSSL
jgi:hypothetical protein